MFQVCSNVAPPARPPYSDFFLEINPKPLNPKPSTLEVLQNLSLFFWHSGKLQAADPGLQALGLGFRVRGSGV